MKYIFSLLLVSVFSVASAQVGYQVSLLNKATGEPRANETVTVEVKITDSKDRVIYSGSQSATTNDFGVLSLSVGSADTFNNVDWNNLPLYVSATVDNVLLGRSQILSVPVAEHAKHTGTLTKEILMSKTWSGYKPPYHKFSFSFSESAATLVYTEMDENFSWTSKGEYYIYGNAVVMPNFHRKDLNFSSYESFTCVLLYIPEKNMLVDSSYGLYSISYK